MRLERIPGITSAGRALRFSPFFTPFARFFAVFENRILIRIFGVEKRFFGRVRRQNPEKSGEIKAFYGDKQKRGVFYE